MLLYVFPALSQYNRVYRADSNPVFFCQGNSRRRRLPDCANALFSKNGPLIRDTLMVSGIKSAFCNAVQYVLSHCSEEQMVWIRTGSIVAFMTHAKTLPNRSLKKQICSPMGQNRFPVLKGKFPIAGCVQAAAPSPTLPRDNRDPRKQYTLRRAISLIVVSLVESAAYFARHHSKHSAAFSHGGNYIHTNPANKVILQ